MSQPAASIEALDKEKLFGIQNRGKLAIPNENLNGYLECEIPQKIVYCADLEILNDPVHLGELLRSSEPLITIGAQTLVTDFTSFGYSADDIVPVYTLLAPKRIGGQQHLLEEERLAFVESTFGDHHTKHLDTQYNYDVLDSSNVYTGSLGIGLYILDKEGLPRCVAASDIKYGSDGRFTYDNGGEIGIDNDYVRKFIESAQTFEDLDGNGIIIENFKGEPDYVLTEIRGDGFQLSLPKIEVEENELPVDTLLHNVSTVQRSRVEIGQFSGNGTFNGGSLYLAAAFLELFKSALLTDKNLKAGFSISPHLLKAIKRVRRIGADNFIPSGVNNPLSLSLTGFANPSQFEMDILSFAYGFNIYPTENCKVTEIKFLDGHSIFIKGAFQAETFEVPAYYSQASI